MHRQFCHRILQSQKPFRCGTDWFKWFTLPFLPSTTSSSSFFFHILKLFCEIRQRPSELMTSLRSQKTTANFWYSEVWGKLNVCMDSKFKNSKRAKISPTKWSACEMRPTHWCTVSAIKHHPKWQGKGDPSHRIDLRLGRVNCAAGEKRVLLRAAGKRISNLASWVCHKKRTFYLNWHSVPAASWRNSLALHHRFFGSHLRENTFFHTPNGFRHKCFQTRFKCFSPISAFLLWHQMLFSTVGTEYSNTRTLRRKSERREQKERII